jgi:5-formyltetrahydrofolate cyclo-ligase
MDFLSQAKKKMRQKAAQTRAMLAKAYPDDGVKLGRHASKLLDHFMPNIIAGFWPIKSELDCCPLMAELSKKGGVELCLPVTGAPETALCFYSWQLTDALDEGPYGTRQPFTDQPEVIPDLILVPLLAFDREMNRLGYGGGFYDRTLASLAAAGHKVITIGLGYDGQEVPNVPVGAFDRKLDGVLTPAGLRLNTD